MKIALLLPITLSELQPLFPNQILKGGYSNSLFVPLIYHYLNLGHEVVICTEDHSSMKSSVYYGENITLFCAGSLPKAKLRAIFDFKYEINQIVKFLENNPCDVYHAHWIYDFAQAAILINREKTVITVHDWPENIRKSYNDFYWSRKLDMGIKTLEEGELFTTVSPYMVENMKNNYPHKHITLIPNFIETSHINQNNEKQFRDSEQVILAISSGFSLHKNIETLIKAFEIVKRELTDCTLRLIGNELGEGEAAHIWANSYSKIKGIEFIGALSHDDVMRHIDDADLLVHPSKEESFGMVILEAMSRSVPVIGGKKSGAVPWVLEGGKCGKLVDIESSESIAKEIISILRNKSELEKLSKQGRNRSNDFSLEVVGEMYLDIYRKVISNYIE